MTGVDLEIFQFDGDLTWAAFFLNADGTVYGRYGSRAGDQRSASTHVSLASFKKALTRALALHEAYPANREVLAKKRGPKPRHRFAEQIPRLREKAGKTTPKSCIHCHMVWESERKDRYDAGSLTPDDVWIYPLPEGLGLHLDRDDCLRVERVAAGSLAASAGVRPGDEMVTVARQPVVSQADVQWVLHHARSGDTIPLALRREGTSVEVEIVLEGAWRRTNLVWRESSWQLRPGFFSRPVGSDEKRALGLAKDALAMEIGWIFKRAATARAAGLRKGDVIVAVDGHTQAMNESELMARIRLAHRPGDRVALVVLRGGKRHELTMELR